MRGAVIDIGSNTIHLLVANCRPNRLKPIEDRTVHSGLGRAVASGGAIGSRRIRLVAGLSGVFAAKARALGVRQILVLGTHAVRVAPDRAALTSAVEASTGAVLEVLSTTQETAMCLLGATLGRTPRPPFMLVDIGGGSSDIGVVRKHGLDAVASVSYGSGTVGVQLDGGDPPAATLVRRIDENLRAILRSVDLGGTDGIRELVVTGGAARRLRRQARVPRDSGPHSTVRLHRTINAVLREPAVRWPRRTDPERVPVTRGGAILLRAIITRWDLDLWRVSPFGLREGALLLWARRATESFAAMT